jgi:hypothetical protein
MATALHPGPHTARCCGSGGGFRLQRAVCCGSAEATMTDELPFKVVRSNGTDEVLARAVNC